MKVDRPSLCLNMIVKNESAIIERCLAAAAPAIQSWVICDTGSEDATPELIERFFATRRIPGELHRIPFLNFEQARNAALECARTSALAYDYLLLVDADMELVIEDPDFACGLTGASYLLLQRNDIAYYNTRLLRRSAPARYVGVTHEYLDAGAPPERLSGAWFIDHAAGANRTGKFDRDARLLEEALVREPANARYVFYLAQSERDAGRVEKARATYWRRAAMGGWSEEIAYALLQIARIDERLGASADAVRRAYLDAYRARPVRIEPLVELARLCRLAGDWPDALLYARAAAAARRPDDLLFVDESAYAWRALDELAIAGWYAGAHGEGRAAATRLLAENRFPPAERDRILANAAYYDSK
jgi:glycosyltransferase involved in cell wall biosynthesis